MQVRQFELTDELGDKLPAPSGYKVLVACPEIEETTASIFGYVISMGKDAYGDIDKFSSGPYCQKGDWVIFRSYSGTRFKIAGSEFRLINDDSVEAVVDDPRGIERA